MKRKSKYNSLPKDYRHEEVRRRNNPPAEIAVTYEVRERKTCSYSYDPHLDAQMRGTTSFPFKAGEQKSCCKGDRFSEE